MGFGGAGDACRLVERNVNLLLLGADQFAVDAYLVARGNPGAQGSGLAVASDAARIDPFIGLAPRTDTGLADVLVESHLGAAQERANLCRQLLRGGAERIAA